MKKVDKFVISSFIGPLVLTFFIVLIILLLQFLWMYVDELAGKGLNFTILGELLFQFSLSFVPTALPLAILLASLMTFGNMGEFSELNALKSSGIPLNRVMTPLLVIIVILVGVSFLFSNYVLPYSNQASRALLTDIRRKRPDINIQAGTFNNDIEGFSIKVSSKDPNSGRLDKLIIYDHRDKKINPPVTVADSGYIKVTPDESAMIMTLYNGHSFTEIEEKNVSPLDKKYPSHKDSFSEQTIVLSLAGFDLERSGNEMFRNISWTMNMEQLSQFIDSLNLLNSDRETTQFKEFLISKVYIERGVKQNFAIREEGAIPIPDSLTFNAIAIYDTLSPESKMATLTKSIEVIQDANNYLAGKTEAMQNSIRTVGKYEVDWHKKLTIPFACMVFFLIGAPLGAIIRKGGLGTPAVISIFFFVVWYVISLSGEKLVEEGLVSTIAGMWASSYLLIPVGLYLTYKASNDSVILHFDTYLTFLRRIRDYLYRIILQVKDKDPDYKQTENDKI